MDATFLSPEFWTGPEPHVLLSPAVEEAQGDRVREAIMEVSLEGVVWLQSSGTESHRVGSLKFVALPKKGILAAAKSVTTFFKITAKDCWLQPLPNFHIGGLSIYARALISGCEIVEMGFPQRWSVASFLDRLQEAEATIASLVPTQVHDLVEAGAHCPRSLRLAVVGGGRLELSLQQKARQLGWPVLPSYGMTETSALMASRPLSDLQSEDIPTDGFLDVLPHINGKLDSEGRLLLEGESLAAGYLFVSEDKSVFEAIDQPFVSDDRVALERGRICILSRDSELVKILGESVNLVDLSLRLSQTFPESREACILPIKDARRGFRLIGFLEASGPVFERDVFNSRVAPFEQLDKLVVLEKFPRTPLGKIKKGDLRLALETY